MSTHCQMSEQFYFKQFSFHLFQTIQFSIRTQFISIWPIDRTFIRCYHSCPKWTWERWQWRATPHFPKLQHYWTHTTRLFSAISRTLVGGGLLPLCRDTCDVFTENNIFKHFFFLTFEIIRPSKHLFGLVLWHINHCRLFYARSSLYIYIKYIGFWFGWVLWHINHCRLFNARSSLYIYIKYIGFCLVGFYGISTIVGYLMPDPLYTYILNI